MRYSREGMWGVANYFAENAQYSDTFAYYDTVHGYKEMMLAKVLTGDSFFSEQDNTLKMPPIKSCPGKGFKVRYDSVNGITRGCRVYMTYCNVNAYPAYIITYRVTGAYSNTPIPIRPNPPRIPPQPNPPRIPPQPNPPRIPPQLVAPQMSPPPPPQPPPPKNRCTIS